MPTNPTRDWDIYSQIDSPLFPGYADRLRELGALDGLHYHDTAQVAGFIITDGAACGPGDLRRFRVSLQQRAANAGCGSDFRLWHDKAAASKALGIAADALNDVGCL